MASDFSPVNRGLSQMLPQSPLHRLSGGLTYESPRHAPILYSWSLHNYEHRTGMCVAGSYKQEAVTGSQLWGRAEEE